MSDNEPTAGKYPGENKISGLPSTVCCGGATDDGKRSGGEGVQKYQDHTERTGNGRNCYEALTEH